MTGKHLCVRCKKTVMGRPFGSIEIWLNGKLRDFAYICTDCLPNTIKELVE